MLTRDYGILQFSRHMFKYRTIYNDLEISIPFKNYMYNMHELSTESKWEIIDLNYLEQNWIVTNTCYQEIIILI